MAPADHDMSRRIAEAGLEMASEASMSLDNVDWIKSIIGEAFYYAGKAMRTHRLDMIPDDHGRLLRALANSYIQRVVKDLESKFRECEG